MTPGAAVLAEPRTAAPVPRSAVTAAAGPHEVSATVTYTASIEQLLARDFPDFPILPGVSVLEYVRLGAEANLPRKGLFLRAIARARFVGAAFPGDELTVGLTWAPVPGDEGAWDCQAEVRTPRGPAALASLRYVAGAQL
ncbi:hypothetical protein ACIQRW_38160 [Streptomyces sp. NPDC091287]|uniref:hypothetical protein n=1 Tax=Streptomyces sp. NPDC091287 TaxID=3365988 RepID=UPI0038278FBD